MPRRNIDRLQGEIEELFADLWQVPRFSGIRKGFRPAVDCFFTGLTIAGGTKPLHDFISLLQNKNAPKTGTGTNT